MGLERELPGRRTLDDGPGLVLRATRRGALVLETVNARRRTRPTEVGAVKETPDEERPAAPESVAE
jgi:hypothetical protein